MTAADAQALDFLAARAGFAPHQARHLSDWWQAAADRDEAFAAFLLRQGLISEPTARIIHQVAAGHLTGTMGAALLDPAELSNARRRLPDVAKLEHDADATVTLLAADDTIRDGSSPACDDPPRVGCNLGKYLLTEWVGKGASGSIFRALHPTLHIPVAVKVLHADDHDLELHHRLCCEARLLARINHPNIVRVYDFESHARFPFLVLEHVNGPTLAELIDQSGRVQPGRAVRIVRQLAEALGTAHRLGIVHRDVKPANVLLTRSGEVKLADLGLAAVHGEALSQVGHRAGTALYMAPELVGTTLPAGELSDLYSLGATLFHALTGVPPFRAERAWEIMGQHARAVRPDPRDLVPAIPAELAELVKRMLAREPAGRPGSFAALLTEPALQRDFDDASSECAVPNPFWQRLLVRLRRRDRVARFA